MTTIRYLLSGLLIAVIITVSSGCGTGSHESELSEKLRKNIELLKEGSSLPEGKVILNPDIITQLYEKGAGKISAMWESQENIEQMLRVIRNIHLEGLSPEDYHLSAIEDQVDKIIESDEVDVEDLARLELLMTDAFLLLSAHLAAGKTDAETIDPQWRAARRTVRIDWQDFMVSTLNSRQIIENLQQLTPRHREYINLKKALVKYQEIEGAGGWDSFSTLLPKLEIGMENADIAQLRSRLEVSQGKIEYSLKNENLFDQNLHDQVVIFQKRNGLDADGVIGKATIEALNIPVSERISSIEANLERWRWLSDDLGELYIMVNIANFELQVIENGIPVFSSEAIVGRPFRETPVFSAVMTYLVFNPDWIVPPTILNNDIIPAVRKNPSYLAEKNMKILRSDGSEVDPASIDWSSFPASGFPYRIRQEPGRDNALGRVKFMFPNQYNVYIHDTPSRNLFAHTDRSFSSGCIRINKPLELAAYLLQNNPLWTPEHIRSVVDRGRETTVMLQSPVRVHLIYLTSWADDEGKVYFRKDIYDRDRKLLAALKQAPPANDQL